LKINNIKAHELAALFPAMSNLQELADDIKEHGLIEDIVTLGDKILDGRQRYAACEMAGIKPRYIKFESLNGKIQNAARWHSWCPQIYTGGI
jgi:Predicted transcriptional regulators